MTDKEKAIKELKEVLENLDITNKYRLNLIRAIEYLQEEPVSEGLEDAAIQICQKVLKGETIVIDGYEYVVLSDAEECFKAGAQWQQEQMMSKAIDALVHTFDNGYIRVGTQLLANNKYGLKVGDKVKVIVIKED